MTNQQGAPEALFYADALGRCAEVDFDHIFVPAAAVIRRLHAENERLASLVDAQQPAPAPQADNQPAVDALAEAEYFIDNPSAWSNFDQRTSDAIAAVCKAFRVARAPADSVTAPAGGVMEGMGWQWVPMDATDDMVRATDKVNFESEDTDGTMHNVWNAMLAAAPKALDVGSLVTRESAIQAIEHVALSHSMGLEAIDMLAAAVAATDEADTVDLVGVRATGEHVGLGKIAMPPRMKAREIARSYFGHFEDEDGSDAELCFGALETLLDWLSKQGWEPNLKPIQGVHPAVSKPLVNQLLEALETSRVLKADYDSLENYGVASRKHAKAIADARAYVATPPAQTADSVLEDAARYRWLRQHDGVDCTDDGEFIAGALSGITIGIDSSCAQGICGADLDAAIDAARAAQEGK